MVAIKTVDLTKRYKDITAVDRLNLEIRQGELFSLLGVNGAGKTTTLKMLSCLTQPTAGDTLLNGKSIRKDTAAIKSRIAVSPQETAVTPGPSVQENLELMCGVHEFTKEKQNNKIKELTQLLGLESVIKKRAGKLSGVWFDLDLVGGVFKKIAYALPFVHGVDMQRAVLAGNFADIFPHLWWVLGYAALLFAAAVALFLRQMKKQ